MRKLHQKIVMRLSQKQLIFGIVGFVIIIGACTAGTIASVSAKRAREEQSRVLRTSSLEEATTDSQSKAETTAEDPQSSTSTNKPTTSTPNAKPTAKTVNFVKGGGSLQGNIVIVSLTADNALNGTCTYSFTLGNSNVTKSNTVSNTKICEISVPLSSFAKSGNWYFKLSYVSSDGMTKGTGGGFEIVINPEVREINFVKGGAGQSDTVVNASSDMTEAQSGTCTFKFALNGVVKVSKTTTISNSKRCSVETPTSEFPESATYEYRLSFISHDTLTIANQAPWDVEVQK